MQNKIFMIFMIMVIIFISGCSKKLSQPELDTIYNRYGIHLDQITKYDNDKYGMVFTEKELCNAKYFELIDATVNAYCSIPAKMYEIYIFNIKTKQYCIDTQRWTVSGVMIKNLTGDCDTNNAYIEKDSGGNKLLQLIIDNKKYIDSYQNN